MKHHAYMCTQKLQAEFILIKSSSPQSYSLRLESLQNNYRNNLQILRKYAYIIHTKKLSAARPEIAEIHSKKCHSM